MRFHWKRFHWKQEGYMAKKWSGDGRFLLPAKQIEPYRLWFEFLKIAHVDPNISVDYDFYADWGPFWELSFNEWWTEDRCRTLFAVDAGVRVLDVGTSIDIDKDAIVVRLPLNKDSTETLEEVRKLLKQRNAGVKCDQVGQGRFGLSEGYQKGFLKYLNKANLMLRLYGIWLKNADEKGRLGKTAVEFYDWAMKRNALIKDKVYKLTPPEFPEGVKAFAKAVKAKDTTPYENERRAFDRYIDKAKKLATNAGAGVFPGRW
jgi:hypothetical protein